MFLRRLLHSKSGKYIPSIVLGMGLATMFRKFCKGSECLVRYAPPSDEIKDKNFKFNNQCYRYEANPVSCKSAAKLITTK